MIEKLYTVPAAAQLLGLKPRRVARLLDALGRPRRMERVPNSGAFRRVVSTGDLEALSAYRLAQATQNGTRNHRILAMASRAGTT